MHNTQPCCSTDLCPIPPPLSLTKSERQRRLEKIWKKILRIAQDGHEHAKSRQFLFSLSCPRIIYRFCLKLEKHSVCLQWERSSAKGTDLGVLHSEQSTYPLVDSRVEQIENLLIGNQSLIHLVAGDEFEHIKVLKAPIWLTRGFNKKAWERTKEKYRRYIYPQCLNFIAKIFSQTKLEILDLCGEDGEFANTLFQCPTLAVERYTLCELNPILIDSAQNLLETQIQEGQVQLFQGDIAKMDFRQLLEDRPVHCILSIGALAELSLSSHELALKVLKYAADSLCEGGYILITAATSSWITADDLERSGLCPLNYSNPAALDIAEVSCEFYLAQKISAQPKRWNFPHYPPQNEKWAFEEK